MRRIRPYVVRVLDQCRCRKAQPFVGNELWNEVRNRRALIDGRRRGLQAERLPETKKIDPGDAYRQPWRKAGCPAGVVL